MATDKPRITITLEPEHYAVLQRMAKVQRGSMARIVTDLFREVAPMLERVTEAMEAAHKAQQGMKASIRKAAEEAERDMQPLVATMGDGRAVRPLRAGARAPRGSGRGITASSAPWRHCGGRRTTGGRQGAQGRKPPHSNHGGYEP